MAALRLYSTAIVLGCWTLLWIAGVHGNAMIGAGLAAATVSAVIAELERSRRRRDRRRT